jgi:hypothetical protein
MITKTFFLAKDIHRIGTPILRDHASMIEKMRWQWFRSG